MGISKRHVWFLEGKCPVPNTKCSCSSISHCWPVCEVYPFFKRALGGGGVVLRERVAIWCCLWQGTSCQFKDVLVIFVGKQTAFGQSPFNVAQGLYYILITSNKWWHTHFQEYGFTWIGKTICCKCLFYKFFPKLQGIFQANVILLSEKWMFRFKYAILLSRMQSAQRLNLWILEDIFEKEQNCGHKVHKMQRRTRNLGSRFKDIAMSQNVWLQTLDASTFKYYMNIFKRVHPWDSMRFHECILARQTQHTWDLSDPSQDRRGKGVIKTHLKVQPGLISSYFSKAK